MYLVLGRLTGKYSEDFESVAVDESDSASDQVITASRVDYKFYESHAWNKARSASRLLVKFPEVIYFVSVFLTVILLVIFFPFLG